MIESPGKQIFSFECRVVGPLFATAVSTHFCLIPRHFFDVKLLTPYKSKCRDGNLRRQAISLLLSSHRREMMLDSLVLGGLSNWIMAIEEEGMDMIGFIPDERRAWGVSMTIDLPRRVVVAKARIGRKAPGQWIQRSTELPAFLT